MTRLALLDAPSNLGLSPPEDGAVPGCHKAPGALRDRGVLSRLGARDAGVLTPPRYRPATAPGRVRNEEAIAGYSRALADRLTAIWAAGERPVVLGGDCSVLLGAALAAHRRGRCGLAFLDGHLDYRHPGNAGSAGVGAAAGEDLALVTGRGGILAGLDGTAARPYVRAGDTAALGYRPDDEYAAEAESAGISLLDAEAVSADPSTAVAQTLRVVASPDLDGFWVHVDADIVDGRLMPAVDCPEPDGLDFDRLAVVLRGLMSAPGVLGLDLAIYDPDLDPSGAGAEALTGVLEAALPRA